MLPGKIGRNAACTYSCLKKFSKPFRCCSPSSWSRAVSSQWPGPCRKDKKNRASICCWNDVWAAEETFAPQVASAKVFAPNDEGKFLQCERPVFSSTHHDKFRTNSVSSRCQHAQFVCSKRARFHTIREFTQHVLRRADNVSPEIARIKVKQQKNPSFVCIPCTWYHAQLQSSSRWNNNSKIVETLKNENCPVFQIHFFDLIRFCRLPEMERKVLCSDQYSVNVQPQKMSCIHHGPLLPVMGLNGVLWTGSCIVLFKSMMSEYWIPCPLRTVAVVLTRKGLCESVSDHPL